MKKILIALFALISIQANSQLEIYGAYTPKNQKVVPDVNFYGAKKLTPTLNLTCFMLVEQNWAEALVGVSYSPRKWLTVEVQTGIEHNPALYRFLGSLWIGKGKTSLSLIGEKGDGKKNYWYKNTFKYQIDSVCSIGLRAWRFVGIGPVFQYKIEKLGITPWCMLAHDFEVREDRIALGVDINL